METNHPIWILISKSNNKDGQTNQPNLCSKVYQNENQDKISIIMKFYFQHRKNKSSKIIKIIQQREEKEMINFVR